MRWQKRIESLRSISTGLFFGGMLIFLQKENLKAQVIILSIGAVLLLFSIFACEVLKYRINRNKEQINGNELKKKL